VVDAEVPTGDITAEYRLIRSGVGSASGHHRLIRVYGSDAVSFLQGLLSQDLESMASGTVQRSFFLQPNGKLAALLWVGVGADEVVLFCDSNVAIETEALLRRYRIRVNADIELDERGVDELWGPAAFTTARVDSGQWRREGDSIVLAAAVGRLPRVFVVGKGRMAPPVGRRATTAVRVEAGEPVMGIDVDTSTIPQECGFIDESVSFTKGCYLGQELVARIDTRGHVNRWLAGIRILTNTVPPQGAEIASGGKIVGTFTSPSESLTLRSPIGLSLIRREVAPGDQVDVRWTFDGEPRTVVGSVHKLPMDDFTDT